MIGLLLVSHSAGLAAATEILVRQMAGAALPLHCAAGAGEDGSALGTDASLILARMEALQDCEAIVVLMDIGSAILSTELARDMATEALQAKIHLSPAPFVEGALAAGVAAAAGLPLARVLAEAAAGLTQKQSGLGPAPAPAALEQSPTVMREAVIADPHGLHLRPAAAFVQRAAGFAAEINLRHGERTARGDSLMALVALGAGGGARVIIEASGRQAEAAAAALAALLATPLAAAPQAPAPPSTPGSPAPISPGQAAGILFVAERNRPAIPSHPAPDRDAARRRLDAAIATAASGLGGTDILQAQAALLTDPAIAQAAHRHIAQDGLNEFAAWHQAIEAAAAIYAGLENPYLRERARDVREVGELVQRQLRGATAAPAIEWPAEPTIVLIDELTAAEAAGLPPQVLGVLDRGGSASSHAAILLRAAGIPALGSVTLDPIPSRIAFDGATGAIHTDPDDAVMKAMGTRPVIEAGVPAVMLTDGSMLEFWANVSSPRDAAAACQAGAYGIGLARTEILFLERHDEPGIDEQAARIAAMIAPFAGRPVVVRALDAGADKPVPFLGLASESNPALGVRGIRALLRRPAFFAAHLRAILRAGAGHDLRIMIPMVTGPGEMQETRSILADICQEWGMPPPPLGAMIEVPAAAIRLRDLAPACDFISIGTNDLTQYVLAAERGNQALSDFADAAHPAILDLCAGIVAQAGAIPVSVCGEAAGEPRTAELLVAAGIRRLSMGAARLPDIRARFSARPMGD
jgi:phosphocarrier protein FPr